MRQVLFDKTFLNPEHLGELKRRQSGSDEQLHDALPRREILFIVHGEWYVILIRNKSNRRKYSNR